ncbi:MAG: radical SAM protein [Chloroflexota bacterium]|nr:MAG: radical SAM protein [Chloroflexota bacterium]
MESPEYVKISWAAAMTLGLAPGKFFRDAKLHCLNLLLAYDGGCAAKCAYCGLQSTRQTDESGDDRSFIRVDWPVVSVDEIVKGMGDDCCSHVERVCVSMVTHARARNDTLDIVRRVRSRMDSISALITPTIVNKDWLIELKRAGVDKLGVAVDAATPDLFDRLRGKGVGGPHRWDRYWETVKEGVDVFGRFEVGIHLMVGLGETEEESLRTIQRAYDMGALSHLFSFFPENGSAMKDRAQPPVGTYRRVQLARHMINKGMAVADDMKFGQDGKLVDFGVADAVVNLAVEGGLAFMTSGCDGGKGMANACNRPFSNGTPYQAYMGELRNYPFKPAGEDVKVIKQQLQDYSDVPTKEWAEGLGCGLGCDCKKDR